MRLSEEFYARPALIAARDLLGHVLVHVESGIRRAGRIVETEAYLGPHDLACHASKGRTGRSEVLFGPPGRSYVYLIYGMCHCFNVVTDYDGFPSAVLVRAVEPLEGISDRTDGPGRLCRAMGLTLAQNKLDLQSEELHVLETIGRINAARRGEGSGGGMRRERRTRSGGARGVEAWQRWVDAAMPRADACPGGRVGGRVEAHWRGTKESWGGPVGEGRGGESEGS